MTGNSKYPLLSPSNISYPFSFYYSSLYPFATIKLTFSFLTIKESIALGNLLYHILVLLSIYEVSQLILRDTKKVRIFFFFCTLFGGLDWLACGELFKFANHCEWWQTRLLGNTQISSFYTGLFWAVHHFLAAYSVILAYAIMFYTKSFIKRSWKNALVLIILISAFYASPFSFVSIPLYLLMHRRTVWRMLKSWYSIPIIISAILPLPIFLNKFPGQTFVLSKFRLTITNNPYIDKMLSLPVYLTLVPFIELIAIPIVLLIIWRSLNKRQKQYVAASWIFFLSTYVIAYSGNNNYSMRGMFIPTFVFFFIFAQHWLRIKQFIKSIAHNMFVPAFSFLILLCIVGILKESAGRTKDAIFHSQMLRKKLGMSAYSPLTVRLYETASDQDIESIDMEKATVVGRQFIYDFEKFIQNLELTQMTKWERELLRRP
jgi:hypothetical protein